jgi:methyl-accepting chemotaxis protein
MVHMPTTIQRNFDMEAGKEKAADIKSGSLVPATADTASLLSYVRKVPSVTPQITCRMLLSILNDNEACECVVICDDTGKPLGMIMRNQFYAKLQGRFSTELYYEKPVMIVADTSPLSVEWDVPPQKLIDLALSRKDDTLYDCVMVTKGGKLEGVMTVSDLLKLSRALQDKAIEEQQHTIRSSESRMKEIENAVRQLRESALQGESMSMEMVDLTLMGKQEIDMVKQAFFKIAANATGQELSMNELQKEAGFVSGVSKLIKDLAEQSNLLAINASIEAARAGEFGKGFAVVAAQVMKLADQTKKSAVEITSVADSILRSIEKTAEMARSGRSESEKSEVFVNEAEEVFNRLFKSAAENRSTAKWIDELSEQAHAQALQVSLEMERLRQSYL